MKDFITPEVTVIAELKDIITTSAPPKDSDIELPEIGFDD